MDPKELREHYKFLSCLLKQYSDLYLKMVEFDDKRLSKGGLKNEKELFEINNSHYLVKRSMRKNGLSILCIRREKRNIEKPK